MVLRVGGLASGIDTDTVVKQMLTADQNKIDKVKGQRDVLQWQQEIYRDFSSQIKTFQSKYFDIVNRDTYALSENFFSSYKASIVGVDSGLINIRPNNAASQGRYEILSMTQAKGANVQGELKTKSGEKATLSTKLSDLNGFDKKEISIKLGEGENITVDTSKVNTVSDLLTAINNNDKLKGKVNSSFSEITGKLKIETTETGKDTKIQITGGLVNALGMGVSGTDSLNLYSTKIDVFNQQVSGGQLKGTNGKVLDIYKDKKGTELDNSIKNMKLSELGISSSDTLKINNNSIVIDPDKTVGQLLDDITNDTNLGVTAKILNGKVSISSKHSGSSEEVKDKTITLSGDNKILYSLGFSVDDKNPNTEVKSTPVKTSERYDFEIPTGKKIDNAKINITMKDLSSKEINFSNVDLTNWKDLTTNEKEDIVYKLNTDNTLTSSNGPRFALKGEKLVLVSEGSNKAPFTVSGNKDALDSLGYSNIAKVQSGNDARVIVKTASGEKGEITSSKNNIIVDGMTFEIKGDLNSNAYKNPDNGLTDLNLTDPTDIIAFNVESNVDKVVDNIKGFVDEYNKLIDSIGNRVYEKKQYKYSPLTDEQKEAMKEDDIKRWEEKAKQGIVRGDNSLEKFLGELRSTLFEKVEGTGISLKDVGIDTSNDFTQRGKLVLDEEKLRTALKEKPDEVTALFSKNSDISYDADKGYAGNEDRKKTNGIFRRMSDIVQDAIRTTRNSKGQKGYLLEKAGVKGDLSEIKNTITDKISEKEKTIEELLTKMQAKETQLYKQFSYLETMMNNYNAQSSWLTQQLGGM